MKNCKRFLSLCMSVVMCMGQTQFAYAVTHEMTDVYKTLVPTAEAARGSDEFAAEKPYGEMNLLLTGQTIAETAEPYKYYVVRRGGTEGEVSVRLKAIDITGKYGKDYEIQIPVGDQNIPLAENPYADMLINSLHDLNEARNAEALELDAEYRRLGQAAGQDPEAQDDSATGQAEMPATSPELQETETETPETNSGELPADNEASSDEESDGSIITEPDSDAVKGRNPRLTATKAKLSPDINKEGADALDDSATASEQAETQTRLAGQQTAEAETPATNSDGLEEANEAFSNEEGDSPADGGAAEGESPQSDGSQPAEDELPSFTNRAGADVLADSTMTSEQTKTLAPPPEQQTAEAETAITQHGGLRAAKEAFTGVESDRPVIAGSDYSVVEDEATQLIVDEATLQFYKNNEGVETTLTFKDGEYIKFVYVVPLDDDICEDQEQFVFALVDAEGGAELGDLDASYVNIVDDEPYESPIVSFDQSQVLVRPGSKYVNLTLKRTGSVETYARVNLYTAALTATPDADYIPVDRDLTFMPGQTVKTISVPILSDRGGGISFSVGITGLSSTLTGDIPNVFVALTYAESIPNTIQSYFVNDDGSVTLAEGAGYAPANTAAISPMSTTTQQGSDKVIELGRHDFFVAATSIQNGRPQSDAVAIPSSDNFGEHYYLRVDHDAIIYGKSTQSFPSKGLKKIEVKLRADNDSAKPGRSGGSYTFQAVDSVNWQNNKKFINQGRDDSGSKVHQLTFEGSQLNGLPADFHVEFIADSDDAGASKVYAYWVKLYYTSYEIEVLAPPVIDFYDYDFTNPTGMVKVKSEDSVLPGTFAAPANKLMSEGDSLTFSLINPNPQVSFTGYEITDRTGKSVIQRDGMSFEISQSFFNNQLGDLREDISGKPSKLRVRPRYNIDTVNLKVNFDPKLTSVSNLTPGQVTSGIKKTDTISLAAYTTLETTESIQGFSYSYTDNKNQRRSLIIKPYSAEELKQIQAQHPGYVSQPVANELKSFSLLGKDNEITPILGSAQAVVDMHNKAKVWYRGDPNNTNIRSGKENKYEGDLLIPFAMPLGIRLEAEDYQRVNGVRYPGNTNGVEVLALSEGSGQYYIGYNETGDFMEYHFDMPSDGQYTVYFNVASPNDATVRLDRMDEAGSAQSLGSVSFAKTGSWTDYTTHAFPIALKKGENKLRLTTASGSYNLDYMDIFFNRIEAENFVASSGGNTVNTENCSEGGKNLSYFDGSDYVEYNVSVPAAGEYEVLLRTSAITGGLKLKVSAGGSSGTADVPNTGNWQSYTTIKTALMLAEGSNRIRIAHVNGVSNKFVNINWLQVCSDDVMLTNYGYVLDDVKRNDIITFYAKPTVAGEYTAWYLRTGDANRDGIISRSEVDRDGDGRVDRDFDYDGDGEIDEAFEALVYGDAYHLKAGSSAPVLYYDFLTIDRKHKGDGKFSGTLFKDTTTILDNKSRSGQKVPVEGATIRVSGSDATYSDITDEKGNFDIPFKDFSDGNYSVLIEYEDINYTHYLPTDTFSTFTLKGTDAIQVDTIRKSGKNSVTGLNYKASESAATLGDHEDIVEFKLDQTAVFSITTKSNTAGITARKARFIVRDYNGIKRHEKEVDVVSNIATVEYPYAGAFNKSDLFYNGYYLQNGDQLYVQLMDNNGHWYFEVDSGYKIRPDLELSMLLPQVQLPGDLQQIADYGMSVVKLAVNAIDLSKFKVDPRDMPDGSPTDLRLYNLSGSNNLGALIGQFEAARRSISGGGEDAASALVDLKDAAKDYFEDEDMRGSIEIGGMEFDTGGSEYFEIGARTALVLSVTCDSNPPEKYVSSPWYFSGLSVMVAIDAQAEIEEEITTPIYITVIIGFKAAFQGMLIVSGNVKDSPNAQKIYVSSDLLEQIVGLVPPAGATPDDMFTKALSSIELSSAMLAAPVVGITAGVGAYVVKATVSGEAGFNFLMYTSLDAYNPNRNAFGIGGVGSMEFQISIGIEILGFGLDFKSPRFEIDLFSASTFGRQMLQSTSIAMGGLADMTMDELEPISRDYLANRSSWQGGLPIRAQAFGLSDAGTETSVLQAGVYPHPATKLVDLGNGSMLMVYLDDDTSRAGSNNKLAAYYSVYSGGLWSQGAIIDDDGTLDGYLDAADIGNAVMVTWTSLNKPLNANDNVVDALNDNEVKVALFDKLSLQMGTPQTVTKKTEEDKTSNSFPRVIYDTTGSKNEALLYYIKSELGGLSDGGLDESGSTINEIFDSYSAIAYRRYDKATGTWSNEYTGKERAEIEYYIPGIDMDEYTQNWYGQGFLDLAATGVSSDPAVYDAAAASVNGLGVYAYILDTDQDITTTEDTELYLQIYNFEEDSFSHPIRVTSDNLRDARPQVARHSETTYLFWVSDGIVKYYNLTELVRNGLEKNNDPDRPQYTIIEGFEPVQAISSLAYDSADGAPNQDDVKRDLANNYLVSAGADGNLYLLWPEQTLRITDEQAPLTTDNITYETQLFGQVLQEKADSDGKVFSDWGRKVQLTDGIGDNYGDLSFFVDADGTMNISHSLYAAVYDADKGVHSQDTSRTSLAFTSIHTASDVRLKENGVTIEAEHPLPQSETMISATVVNMGLLPSNSVTFRFYEIKDGTQRPMQVLDADGNMVDGVVTLDEYMASGAEKTANVRWAVPEDMTGLQIKVEVVDNTNNTSISEQTLDIPFEPVLSYRRDIIAYLRKNSFDYYNVLQNVGNDSFSALSAEIYAAHPQAPENAVKVGAYEIGSMAAREQLYFNQELEISGALFDENQEVLLSYKVLDEKGAEVLVYSVKAAREIPNDIAAAGNALRGLSLSTLGVKVGQTKELSYTVNSSHAADAYTIKWVSDNPDVASVDSYGNVTGNKTGRANITAAIWPSFASTDFYDDGVAQLNGGNALPDEMIKTASATVTVTETTVTDNTGGGSRGGGGGTTVKSKKAMSNEEKKENLLDLTNLLSWFEEYNRVLKQKGMENVLNQLIDLKDHWGRDVIAWAMANGFINPVSKTRFSPDASVTRAETAEILGKVLQMFESDTSLFNDVAKSDPAAKYLEALRNGGIINGVGDGKFDPKGRLTREQMAAILVRLYEKMTGRKIEITKELVFNDVDRDSWALVEIRKAYEIGVAIGDSAETFAPKRNLTRAELLKMLHNFTKLLTEFIATKPEE